MKKKLMAIALCTIIGVMAIAGSSLAWLKAETDTVTNTFTEGLVGIDLYEHDYVPDSNTLDNATKVTENTDYKMVPGKVLPKDPTVVVKAKSEACYVFIKVEEVGAVDTFLTYSVDLSVWTALPGVDGVYYKEITTYTTTDTELNVLTNKKVTVNSTVEIDDMTGLTAENAPQLKFTAYAIQQLGFADAAAAWAELGIN